MSLDPVREKLSLAVHTLATSDDNIQDRLAYAAQILIRLEPKDLPEGLVQQFSLLLNDLSYRRPRGTEGAILATTSQLDSEQSALLANRIVNLYTAFLFRN